jgi:hypothetical protein
MKRMRKRGFIVLAVAAVMVWYTVRIDGALRPVQRALTVTVPNATLVTPALYRSDADPHAVYVVFDALRPDKRFDATRVDSRTGAQTPAVIAIGPGSGMVPFTDADVRVAVAGLSLRRPSFHLLRFPEGGGPGVHLVDSDTGVVRLTAGDGATRRTLIARWVFNSSTTGELRSQASTDAAGRTIAVVARSSAGWTLHLFDKFPEES